MIGKDDASNGMICGNGNFEGVVFRLVRYGADNAQIGRGVIGLLR
jgi:hypothetical protein